MSIFLIKSRNWQRKSKLLCRSKDSLNYIYCWRTPLQLFIYDLIEQAKLRNKLIDRVDVLNKVKELFLIPKVDLMSTAMVAEFYEVDSKIIFQTYMRNQEELVADGVKTIKCSDLRVKLQNEVSPKRSKTLLYIM